MATKAQGRGSDLSQRSARATAPQQQTSAAPLQGARLAAGVLGASDLLQLQRAIGNRACGRLLSQGARHQQAPQSTLPAVLQRLRGEALIVKQDNTELSKTKSIRANKHAETLKQNTLGVEMGGRTDTWVKIKVQGLPAGDERDIVGLQGWLEPNDVEVEPGTIAPDGDLDDAPAQYQELQGTLFGQDVSSDDIQQGGVGDCWLMSTLAALADTGDGEALIRAMIDEQDDSYHVRFYYYIGHGAFEPRTITVSKRFPVDESGEAFYAGKKGGLWPLVIEKAFAESRGGYFNLKGGSTYNAFAVITGRFPQGYSLRESNPEMNVDKLDEKSKMLEVLIKAQEDDQPVTARVPVYTMQENQDFVRFNYQGNITYMGVISRRPNGRVGMSVKYQMQGRDIERNWLRNNESELHSFQLDKEKNIWTIEFKPERGENRDKIPAQVTYFTSDLGVKDLVANHAYQVYKVDQDQETVDLVDPNKTDELVTISLDDMETYSITFYVGSVPQQE